MAGSAIAIILTDEESLRSLVPVALFDCVHHALSFSLRQHARRSRDTGASQTFLAFSKADRRPINGYYCPCHASVEYSLAIEPCEVDVLDTLVHL